MERASFWDLLDCLLPALVHLVVEVRRDSSGDGADFPTVYIYVNERRCTFKWKDAYLNDWATCPIVDKVWTSVKTVPSVGGTTVFR